MNELLPGLSHAPNIHPLVVHFPVALWPAALLFAVVGAWRGRDDLFKVGRWLAYLGMIGAALAVATGFLATAEMGHDAPGHDLVHVHRDFMIVASILGLVTTILFAALRKRQSKAVQWTLVAALSLSVVVMTLGADRGAALVFQYGVGTSQEQPPATVHQHEGGDDHEHGKPAHRTNAPVPVPPTPATEQQGSAVDAPGAPNAEPARSSPTKHKHQHDDHDHH